MKNNKGFTLIELLAVIVVLAIVMVLATTTVLPYMSTAREDAFLIEASNAVEAADMAMNLYTLGDYTFSSDSSDSLKINSEDGTTTACFTIKKLIDISAYNADKETFDGKVIVTTKDKEKSYILYFKKNSEFAIIGGTIKNYTKKNSEIKNVSEWTDDYSKCSEN